MSGLILLKPPTPHGLTTAPEAEDCAELRYPSPDPLESLWSDS